MGHVGVGGGSCRSGVAWGGSCRRWGESCRGEVGHVGVWVGHAGVWWGGMCHALG